MFAFTTAHRTAHRTRRIPSVASLVRVLGSVRVYDHETWSSVGPGRSAHPSAL